jgi:hypothetical protein
MGKILKIIPTETNSSSFINIKPAIDFIPEWYRKSSSSINNSKFELTREGGSQNHSTFKKCSPFFDAMTSGYIAFLTADIEVIKNPDGSQFIAFRTIRKIVTEHSPLQWNGVPVPDGYTPFVFKWHNQFGLSTPKEYSLFFTNPVNRFDLPFYTISGIVDTDKYDAAVHFPFFIKKDFFGIIEKGTPVAQIIPIKRDVWNREIEKEDESKAQLKLEQYFSTIKRSYKNNFWTKKEYR